MNTRPRLHDRRAADRPSSGDTAVCPKCTVGIVEFNERYRVQTVTGETVAIPAWICDRPDCRYEQPARREHASTPRAILHGSQTVPKRLARKKAQ